MLRVCWVHSRVPAVRVAPMRSFKANLRAAAADDFAQPIVRREGVPAGSGDDLSKLDICPTTLSRKLICWVDRALKAFPADIWTNA